MTHPVSADFQVGTAVRDITPQQDLVQWGYSSRTGPATGTLDPLNARAAVFKTGGDTFGLVQLDLGRVPLKDMLDRIRDRARTVGVDDIFFTASHTHQAPPVDIDGDAKYLARIEDLIGDAVVEAANNLQEARIGVGRTEIDIAHNRRLILEDGSCMMVWRNVEKKNIGPVDKEAGVIKITDTQGKPIAVFVNYACHPVVLGPDHYQYSADFVGEMSRLIKDDTGAECFFLNGGCGDINPYMDKSPIAEGGVDTMRVVGKEIADGVLSVLNGIETVSPVDPSLQMATHYVEVGTRWDLTKKENQDTLRSVYGYLFDKYMVDLKPDLAVPITIFLMNNNLALVGMPGELFVEYQLELKSQSSLKDTFMVGYTNEFHIYFPTIKACSEGGYGANVNTYVGVGAGDKMVAKAVEEIGLMTGKIHPVAQVSDFILKENVPTPQ
ncbi:MAG: hypothetical protein COA73_01020 [Candidatus Hydrogenedentota bacterium]|nr:MAG: hypothetical protein COA73_01020 [Candidatus Hydrogenedentota bacterium]